jgi:hypothetical protein
MPEIRDILEGESRSVDLEPRDFERLLRRRERLERGRRIRAGVTGMAVFLVTGLVLARSIGGDDGGFVPLGPGSPTTSSSTSVTPSGEEVTFGPFGASPAVTVAAAVPDGWDNDVDFGAISGPDQVGAGKSTRVGVLFFTTDSLFSDPCHWDVAGTGAAEKGDVEVGPSADDLVAAVGENTFYTSTDPTPVTIDGYSGQEIEIQLPDDSFSDCDVESGDRSGNAYLFPISVYAQGPANIWHLNVLDVDGTRLVAAVLSYPESSQADLDTARNVIETMDIQV